MQAVGSAPDAAAPVRRSTGSFIYQIDVDVILFLVCYSVHCTGSLAFMVTKVLILVIICMIMYYLRILVKQLFRWYIHI